MFHRTIKCHFALINRLNNFAVTRQYAPRKKQPRYEESEPGISRRMPYFKEDFLEIDNPEVIDSMEPNFMNLGDVHRKHEKEITKLRENVQRMIVGKKYFRTKSPNLLTYNEKEQIKALHEEDPDQWTADKLSESFPADPFTISLVIKSKWIPKDTHRIYKHDESVRRNWKEFNEGKLSLDPILAEHLKKFALRDFNKLAKEPTNKRLGVNFPKPRSNEFLSIVASCEKYTTMTELKQIEPSDLRIPKTKPAENDNSFLINSKQKFSSEQVTLSELQQTNSEIDSRVKLNETSNTNDDKNYFEQESVSENNFISLCENDEKIRKSLDIKEKISIPKNLFEKGKVYQVSDCFYADDGEFLYRVPGFFKS